MIRRPAIPRILVPGLLSLMAVLPVMLWEIVPVDEPAAISPGTVASLPPAETAAGPTDPGKYAVIAERPLFVPTRRPVAVEGRGLGGGDGDPAPPPPPPPPLPQLTLVGVVVRADLRTAMVRKGTSSLHLHLGDEVEGWRLEEISPQGLTFRHGERKEIVAFPKAASRR